MGYEVAARCAQSIQRYEDVMFKETAVPLDLRWALVIAGEGQH